MLWDNEAHRDLRFVLDPTILEFHNNVLRELHCRRLPVADFSRFSPLLLCVRFCQRYIRAVANWGSELLQPTARFGVRGFCSLSPNIGRSSILPLVAAEAGGCNGIEAALRSSLVLLLPLSSGR